MAKRYSEEWKEKVSQWVKKHWETFEPNEEYRKKMADNARKANSMREYKPKPICELKTPAAIKKVLIYYRWNKCEECNWDKKNCKWVCPIQMHHIDWNPSNNTEENLKLLCPNCHSLTDNYMNMWKKNNTWFINDRTRERYRKVLNTAIKNHWMWL